MNRSINLIAIAAMLFVFASVTQASTSIEQQNDPYKLQQGATGARYAPAQHATHAPPMAMVEEYYGIRLVSAIAQAVVEPVDLQRLNTGYAVYPPSQRSTGAIPMAAVKAYLGVRAALAIVQAVVQPTDLQRLNKGYAIYLPSQSSTGAMPMAAVEAYLGIRSAPPITHVDE